MSSGKFSIVFHVMTITLLLLIAPRVAKAGGHWEEVPANTNGTPFKLAAKDGVLYALVYPTIGNDSLEKYDTRTGHWTTLGIFDSGSPTCIGIQGDDVYIGGAFSAVLINANNHVVATKVVRYNITSGNWYAVGDGSQIPGPVQQITADALGAVYVGITPDWESYDLYALHHLVSRWTAATGWVLLPPVIFDPSYDSMGGVEPSALASDGQNVFLSGSFTSAQQTFGSSKPVYSRGILKWDSVLAQWCAMYTTGGCDGANPATPDLWGRATSFARLGDYLFLAGPTFVWNGSAPITMGLECCSLDGAPVPVPSTYLQGNLTDAACACATADALYVGGTFTAPGSSVFQYKDGLCDDLQGGLRQGDGTYPASVSCMAADQNSMYVGGSFDWAGCLAISSGIARWVEQEQDTCASLVDWWPFENSYDDVWGSSSGVPMGNCAFSAGKVGQGLLLDGFSTVQAMGIPNVNSFTVEAWIQPLGNGANVGQHAMFHWGSNGNANAVPSLGVGYLLYLQDGCLCFQMADQQGNLETLTTATDLRGNAWHHVAVSVSLGCRASLFVDGQFVAALVLSSSACRPQPASQIAIGGFVQGGVNPNQSYFLQGRIDEFSIYNSALGAREIHSIWNLGSTRKPCLPHCSTANCLALPSGALGWWQGEFNALDFFHRFNGDATAGVGYTKGKTGLAMRFSGPAQMVYVQNAPELNPAGAVSLEAWVNFSSLSDTVSSIFIAGKCNSLAEPQFMLTAESTSPDSPAAGPWVLAGSIGPEVGGVMTCHSGTAIELNTWYHVVLTYDGADVRFYVNGNIEDLIEPYWGPGDILAYDEPFRIGSIGDGVSDLNGAVDEVRLYSRALEGSEVYSLYLADCAGACPDEIGAFIVKQPLSQSARTGLNVTFGVTPGGTPPFSYQWSLNGAAISGATTDTLLLPNVQRSQAGAYSVVVMNAYGAVQSTPATLSFPGVTGYWPLNGMSGGVIPDLSGGNHFGSMVGSGWSFVPGEVSSALYLGGNGQGVTVGSSSDLDIGPETDFSIEAWVQPLTANTSYGVMNIVDKRDTDSGQPVGYELCLINGAPFFQFNDNNLSSPLGFGAGWDLRNSGWHHVAVTLQRAAIDGLKLYVDGNLVGHYDPTGKQGSLITGKPFLIGLHPTPGLDCNFRGGIDEVYFHRRVLTPEEIHNIFASGGGIWP